MVNDTVSATEIVYTSSNAVACEYDNLSEAAEEKH
jgi:hypothetical protein